MKYIILIVSILTVIIFLGSCKGSKKIVLDSYDGPKLTFGSGGGFAGTSTEKILLPNGQVYLRGNRSKTFSVCEPVDENKAKQMFKNFESLGFTELDLNDPGNMTYFISLEDKGVSKRITWGGGNTALDPNVKTYFNTLGMLTRDKKAIQ